MERKSSPRIFFFATVVLLNMSASFAHPVTPTIFKSLNLGNYMFGVALGSMMIVNFLLSPFWGMWMATFILTPFAFLLMRSAANDSKFFNSEFWKKIFKRKKQIQKTK